MEFNLKELRVLLGNSVFFKKIHCYGLENGKKKAAFWVKFMLLKKLSIVFCNIIDNMTMALV